MDWTVISAFTLLYLCTATIGGNFDNIAEVGIDFIARLIEGL